VVAASTTLFARSSGTQLAGSVLWHASSMTATSYRRCPSTWLSSPVSVAQTTLASSRMRSIASAFELRTSPSRSRASSGVRLARRAAAVLGPLVGLPEERERVAGELTGVPGVGVLLGEQVERPGAQLGQDAGRVPEPHRALAGREQLLQEVIDRVVARGARQHRVAAPDGRANELDDGGGFSRYRAGRG
jgi:hypothetical protein